MIDAGMDVARLNFSHGDHKTHGKAVDTVREALKQRKNKQVAILLDTKGPEIRTGFLQDKQPVTFTAGQDLDIITDYNLIGDQSRLACSYKELPTTVQPGSMTCTVKECHKDRVTVRVDNDCTIGERKNMNLPGAIVALPTLTEQDEDDLVEFGLEYGIDMVAASFVRKASDIEYIRDVLGPRGQDIKIIAKIENQEGLHNYKEIL